MAPSGKAPSGGRGGRFAKGMDPAAAALNASVHFDRRLLRDDVRGSQAHARMLASRGLMSAADADAMVSGLDRVAAEFESGERQLDPALEDVHMNVEARLIEIDRRGGPPPAHRAQPQRSGRDRSAAVRAARCAELVSAIDAARLALCRRAREHVDTLLPGYTHLQRAQPVRSRTTCSRTPRCCRATAAACSTPNGAPANRRSARARWRGRRCRSIARRPRRRSASRAGRRTTASTRSAIATSRSSSRSRAR